MKRVINKQNWLKLTDNNSIIHIPSKIHGPLTPRLQNQVSRAINILGSIMDENLLRLKRDTHSNFQEEWSNDFFDLCAFFRFIKTNVFDWNFQYHECNSELKRI